MVNAAGGGVDIAAQMLHPLTIRYLRNLTWKRNPVTEDQAALLAQAYRNFLNESSDSYTRWEKLS